MQDPIMPMVNQLGYLGIKPAREEKAPYRRCATHNLLVARKLRLRRATDAGFLLALGLIHLIRVLQAHGPLMFSLFLLLFQAAVAHGGRKYAVTGRDPPK